MKAQATVVWFLLLFLQALAVSGAEVSNVIPLDSNNSGLELDNSLPTDDSSSSSSVTMDSHVLEKLESLEQENQRLRHELEQTTLRLTAMVNAVQEESVEIRQEMANNAAQVTTLVTDVSKTMMEDLQEQSEMVQSQLSDIFSFLQEVKTQQASLGEQAEMVHNVLNVVQEFEDQGFNFTNRLESLETKLASVEGVVLQFLVTGSCGCSDEMVSLRRRVEGVESALTTGRYLTTTTPRTDTNTDGSSLSTVSSARLVGSSSSSEGRLEVLIDGRWGTVCDDGFDVNAARVACRMLGLSSSREPIVRSSAYYGQGSGEIVMDDVMCAGNEPNLGYCGFTGSRHHNCDHSEDVGIDCQPPASVSSARLVGSSSSSEGRLEVLIDGRWGTVCDDDFDVNDARVACRMLGMSSSRAPIVRSSAYYGQGSGDILMDDVRCAGNETNLDYCRFTGSIYHNCGHGEDVGIDCQPPASVSSARLVGSSSSSEGRLEVLIDGRWGTVCDDDFDVNDARVACRMLGLSSGRAPIVRSSAFYGQGSGDILMDDVRCAGNETNLDYCGFTGSRHHNCDHSEDVGIDCPPPVSEPTPTVNHVVSTSVFDGKEVLVNSILVTNEGKVLLADRIGRWLFMSSVDSPGDLLYARQLGHASWALQQLPDGTVAITLEFSNDIAIVRVEDDELKFVRTIHTGADYGGIALGPEEDTLVVAKWQLNSTARLDVINMQGEVVRTLLDNSSLLVDPYCLRRYGDDLYVSDWTSDSIFRVNIHTGEVQTTLGSLNLKSLGLEAPRAFDMDQQGTIYLASESTLCGFCILRITQAGEVTIMDELGPQYDGRYPYAVEVSGDQIILSWTDWDGQWETELVFASLPVSTVYTVPPTQSLITSTVSAPTTPLLHAFRPWLYDEKDVLVAFLLVTREGMLIMADRVSHWLYMSSVIDPNSILYSEQLSSAPFAVLELPGGDLAVTFEFSNDIAVYRVSGSDLQLVRTIQAADDYGGIAPGMEEGTMVVSKWQLDSTARLDVINMQGEVVRTLLDNSSLLVDPFCIRRFGHDVYVSDWTSGRFFKVDVLTGEVNTTMGELDLLTLPISEPRTFDVDEEGTVYLATRSTKCTRGSFCILKITQSGQVKVMDHLRPEYNGFYPYAVEVFGNQIILTWTIWDGQWETELTFYSLPESSDDIMPSPAPLVIRSATSLPYTPPSTPTSTASPLSTYSEFSRSLFTTLLITREGKLLASDFNAQMVRMISMERLDLVEDVAHLGMKPWSLAEMDDGTVVVSSQDDADIAFLRVDGSSLEFEDKVYTVRRYSGAAVCGDGSLVVSTHQNDNFMSNWDAHIDVISRNGDVMETLLDGANFTDLVLPSFLTCRGEQLFVSDWGSHKVFVLDVLTGLVTSAFGDHDLAELDLYEPRVVAFDQQGNMYLATGGRVCEKSNSSSPNHKYETFCILQVSPQGGWKHLEKYQSPVHGLFQPDGLAISGDKLFISWGEWRWYTNAFYTVLAAYDLPVTVPPNVTSAAYNSTTLP